MLWIFSSNALNNDFFLLSLPSITGKATRRHTTHLDSESVESGPSLHRLYEAAVMSFFQFNERKIWAKAEYLHPNSKYEYIVVCFTVLFYYSIVDRFWYMLDGFFSLFFFLFFTSWRCINYCDRFIFIIIIITGPTWRLMHVNIYIKKKNL